MKNKEFMDIQVNGYGGVDFNQDEVDADGVHRACELLESHGVRAILLTLITERMDLMLARLRKLVAIRAADARVARMVAGFHLEGPFIHPEDGYRGAHPRDAVRPADLDAMKQLLDAGAGLTRLVTLAPEFDQGLKVTGHLVRQHVAVAAGHCDPTLDQLKAAADAGLSLFTHLGNGCPKQIDRHDNIIQRVLSVSDRIRPCFIADGAHVPFFALGNYLRAAGLDRCIVVSDAVSPAGLGPGRYRIGRWELDVGEDMVVRAPGDKHLVGSAGTMPRAFDNLVKHVGLNEAEALRLTRDNPAQAVGIAL